MADNPVTATSRRFDGLGLALPAFAGAASLAGSVFLSPLQIMFTGLATVLLPLLIVSSAGVIAAVSLTSPFETIPQLTDTSLYLLKWFVTFGFLVIALLRKVAVGEAWDWSPPLPIRAAAALLAWSLVCVPGATHPTETLIEIVRFAILLLLFMVTRECVRDRRALLLVGITFLASVAASSLYSLLQLWTEGFFRVRGFFNNANSFGIFVSFALPMAIVLAYAARSRMLKLFALACTCPALVAVGMTWSRAAILNLVVQALAFLVLERQWRWLRRIAWSAALLGLIVMMTPSAREMVVTAARLKGGATHRTLLWAAAANAVADNPLFGQGYGLKQHEVVGRLMVRDPGVLYVFGEKRTKDFLPHNQFLVHAVSTGIPGLILAAVFYLVTIRYFLRAQRGASNASERMVQSAAVALVLGALANGLFEGGVVFGKGAINNYFWIALGLAAAVARHGIYREPADVLSRT